MWKNLKGYFIIEEEGKQKPASTLPDKRKEPSSNPPAPSAPASAPPPSAGKVADKFVEVLLQAMERANLPGFDYLEYKKSLQNLEKMNFDEATRFQTAFAAAQSMGVTPAQLVESAAHYLQALKTEEDKFSAALKKQQTEQVSGPEQQLQQYEQKIARQEAEIKKLQAAIEQTRKQQTELRRDIEQSRRKIHGTAADFEKTYRTIAGSIEADVEKMRRYLK
jgi:hypothetical protein